MTVKEEAYPCYIALTKRERLDVYGAPVSPARPILVRAHHNLIKGFPPSTGQIADRQQATYKD